MSDTPRSVGRGPAPARRRSRRWAVAVILLLAAGAAVWLAYGRVTRRGAVIVFRISPAVPNPAGPRPKPGEFDEFRREQAAVVRSRAVLDRALDALKGQDVPLVQARPNPAGWLEEHLRVDFAHGPELMRVWLDGDPEQAMAVLNAVAAAYLAEVERAEAQRRPAGAAGLPPGWDPLPRVSVWDAVYVRGAR